LANGFSFVEINLREMEGAIYESGKKIRDFDVLAKGREGTWWETPTGNYRQQSKQSSIWLEI